MTYTSVVNNFLELVKIDSPTGHESNVANWIQEYLASIHIPSQMDSVGNVVVRLPGANRLPPILLAAHMDTVEPGRGVKPHINEHGFIRSDGTTILGADNKAGIAIILSTLITYSKLPKSKRRPVEIVFTVSEESENIGAINLDYSQIKSRVGYSFDDAGAIGNITIASPAYVHFNMKIIGKASHASSPEDGVSVIAPLAFMLSEIKTGRINDDTLINIGTGSFGDTTNSVPGSASLVGEIRSMTEENIDIAIEEINQVMDRATKQFNIKIILTHARENGALNLSENDPFVQDSLSCVRKIIPQSHLKRSWGCSDANIFIDHGISVINIADGSLYPHGLGETISIDSLNTMVKIATALIT